MNRIKKLIDCIFKKKEIRFIFVGGINTIVGYGSYAILLFISVDYILANFLSTIIGVINSYIWNKLFTFKSYRRSLKELFRFILVYAVNYLLNLVLLVICVDHLLIDKYISGIICLFVTTIISYAGHNFFVFKKRNTSKQ